MDAHPTQSPDGGEDLVDISDSWLTFSDQLQQDIRRAIYLRIPGSFPADPVNLQLYEPLRHPLRSVTRDYQT